MLNIYFCFQSHVREVTHLLWSKQRQTQAAQKKE